MLNFNKREKTTMKEYELTSKPFWPNPLPIRYTETEIEIFSRNRRTSIVVPIQRGHMSIIKQVLGSTEPLDNKDFYRVTNSIFRIIDAMDNVDLGDSTPAERELKIAAAKKRFQDKLQKKG